MESLRFFGIFFVCYFYCKKCALFIPENKGWIAFLNYFVLVNIVWHIFVFILSEIAFKFVYSESYLLCQTSIFLMLRISSEITCVLFFILGVIITKNVKKEINRRSQALYRTQYETKLILSQNKSIFKLWVVIVSYCLVSIICIVFDSVMYQSQNCQMISSNKTMNGLIWLFDRSVSYCLWTIIVIYVFWPKYSRNNNSGELLRQIMSIEAAERMKQRKTTSTIIDTSVDESQLSEDKINEHLTYYQTALDFKSRQITTNCNEISELNTMIEGNTMAQQRLQNHSTLTISNQYCNNSTRKLQSIGVIDDKDGNSSAHINLGYNWRVSNQQLFNMNNVFKRGERDTLKSLSDQNVSGQSL
ncbi:UNKNOWN [Stylonychia lemnae]|uniref:Uncharacterized protein n=1 Tax=Stylonychia lemnae TaxID=5949 RepID=A0A078AJW1_STYLE|nr:UNKNOWN [Stylonychia lemnae]|eukprot:CDW82459.1 UNKNOWN [Stylonychia lemnae]